jgi:hypothetical protein
MRSLRKLRIEGRLQPLPDAFFTLPALEMLILYLDDDFALPPGLGALTTLRHLDVRADCLLMPGPWLGNLVNLEELNLWPHCRALPPEIGKLERLRTIYANVDELPPELSRCPIESLNWEHMTIDDEKRAVLRTFLSLRQMKLSKNEARTIKPHLPPGKWRKTVRGRVATYERTD